MKKEVLIPLIKPAFDRFGLTFRNNLKIEEVPTGIILSDPKQPANMLFIQVKQENREDVAKSYRKLSLHLDCC